MLSGTNRNARPYKTATTAVIVSKDLEVMASSLSGWRREGKASRPRFVRLLFSDGPLRIGLRQMIAFAHSYPLFFRHLGIFAYRFRAAKTLTEGRPLTSSPALCWKSAIAALLLVPTCPSGSPPMS